MVPIARWELWQVSRLALRRYSEERADRLAAALAYHSIFSLAPLFMLAVVVSTHLLGRVDIQGRLLGLTETFLGTDAVSAVEPWLRSARRPGAGLATTVVGLLTMLFGASRVFIVLHDALNAIYRVPPRRRGLRGFLHRRLLAVLAALAILALLAAAPAVGAAVAWLGEYQWPAAALGLAAATFVFATIYRYAADARVPWRPALAGGAATAGAFLALQSLFALYLRRLGFASVYGASASLVALLLWLYLSSQLLLLGAALVRVHSDRWTERRAARAPRNAGVAPLHGRRPS
ncbi:MAG: YihY family inner membrane protein [Elusimicrobia bacterium]|nr:YihY family inner membrane protein [Elusimicrobiota bacterium]